MKYKVMFIFVLIQVLSTIILAHPGSGIVVDQYGQVYFTDTGKGIWKIDAKGNLIFLPASRFHWMALDQKGGFSTSPGSFGNYFEKIAAPGSNASLILCSDFPVAIGKDGNVYYANTRPTMRKIIRRTAAGRETVVATDKAFEFITGIATGPDGSLYITEASDPKASTIRKVSMNGKVTIVATYTDKKTSDPPLETTASYCRGLAVDALGNVFVAATGSRAVLKITPRGAITTLLIEASPWTPTGIALFQGAVYVLEWKDVTPENLEVRTAHIPRVRKIAPSGQVTTIATVTR